MLDLHMLLIFKCIVQTYVTYSHTFLGLVSGFITNGTGGDQPTNAETLTKGKAMGSKKAREGSI